MFVHPASDVTRLGTQLTGSTYETLSQSITATDYFVAVVDIKGESGTESRAIIVPDKAGYELINSYKARGLYSNERFYSLAKASKTSGFVTAPRSFVLPVGDISLYGTKVSGTTYTTLRAAVPDTRYLIALVDLLSSTPSPQSGVLIDTVEEYDLITSYGTRGLYYRPVYYSIPISWFPDYFQLTVVSPRPNKNRSTYYFTYTLNPEATPKDPAVMVQDYATDPVYFDDEQQRWIISPGRQFAVDMKPASVALPGYSVYRRVSESSTANLRNTLFLNLNLTKTIFLPISDNLQILQLSCTDGSVFWDDSDIPLIDGKANWQIQSAPLKSKVAIVGDRNQTFEMYGQRFTGPFVFRSAQSVVQIVRDGGFLDSVYRVTPMLLQPMGATTPSTNRIVYTTSSTITPQNNDTVIIDGPGRINLPLAPVDGFRFTLDDRKFRRLAPARNSVVPATGDSIGAGQTAATIDHLQPIEWIAEDAGSFSGWVYEAAAKNWVVLLTRAVAGTAITQGAQRDIIFTGNTDVTPQPYDRLYLNGNGNILLTQITAERQFIDIDWQVGATWTTSVICPIGYTIMGQFQDLEINTALTSVTHLRLTLKPGNDFGVNS